VLRRWLACGFAFLALVGTTCVWGLRHAFVRSNTQRLLLVVYAALVANAFEGIITLSIMGATSTC
jgi:hypothetical protein